MAKLTAEEFINKYSEKIKDNDDLLIELMEDATDSIDPQVDSEEIAKLQEANAKLEADYQDLKEKYKMRFLTSTVEQETVETPDEEPTEEEVIDIKEI